MSKFLIGDRVVRLNGSTPVPTGSVGTVARLPSDGGYDEWCYVVWDHKPGVEFFTCGRFLDPEAPRLRAAEPNPYRASASHDKDGVRYEVCDEDGYDILRPVTPAQLRQVLRAIERLRLDVAESGKVEAA